MYASISTIPEPVYLLYSPPSAFTSPMFSSTRSTYSARWSSTPARWSRSPWSQSTRRSCLKCWTLCVKPTRVILSCQPKWRSLVSTWYWAQASYIWTAWCTTCGNSTPISVRRGAAIRPCITDVSYVCSCVWYAVLIFCRDQGGRSCCVVLWDGSGDVIAQVFCRDSQQEVNAPAAVYRLMSTRWVY